MSTRCSKGAMIVAGAIATLLIPGTISAQTPVKEGTTARLEVPRTVRAEHEMLHLTLMEATKAPGRVGTSAQALAAVLEPHFLREEQMAMPLLGLLAPMAAGATVPDAVAAQARTMSETLRREMTSMLDEHKKVEAAVNALRQAAVAERTTKFQQLAEDLARHAQLEEDVMYPAAVLVGDLLRARQAGR